jgi:hypothetical protein
MPTSSRFANRHRNFRILAMLLGLAGIAGSAQAEAVFKCRSADGHVAYQDRACAASQTASRIEILPAPPVTASPEYGVGHSSHARSAPRGRSASKARAEAVSYECRAANGEVFYRHGGCPKSVTAKARDASGGKPPRGAASQTSAVSAAPLARGDVCRRMAASGSIGRAGHERDDTVSSYERNLGRDPCRRF